MELVKFPFPVAYPLLYDKLILWAAERLACHQNWFVRENREFLALTEHNIWECEADIRRLSNPDQQSLRKITNYYAYEQDTRDLVDAHIKLGRLQSEKEFILNTVRNNVDSFITGVIDNEYYKTAIEQVHSYIDDLYTEGNFLSFAYWSRLLSRPEKWYLKQIIPKEGRKTFMDWGYVQVEQYQVLTEPTQSLYRDKENRYIGRTTRNSYGCYVLNAARLFFIDIDIRDEFCDRNESAGYTNRREALEFIHQFSSRNKDLGFRVYNTAGGLRLIETTREWSPTSPEVNEIMKELRADPLYITLCNTQETFRARLTPKPWRLFGGDEEDYATTSFECIVGREHVNPSLEGLILYHSNQTRSAEDLELA